MPGALKLSVLAAALALPATVFVAAVLAVPGTPPNPPGMNPDGSLDPSAFPAEVSVVGADGQPVLCGGKPLTVGREELLAPPPPPTVLGRVADGPTLVPRCGPGGTVKWVPLPEG